MTRILKAAVVSVAICLPLSACSIPWSWLKDTDGSIAKGDGTINPSNDMNMSRYHQLQQQIEKLQAENARLRNSSSMSQDYKTTLIAADQSITVLDRVLAIIDQYNKTHSMEMKVGVAPIDIAPPTNGVLGSLTRNQSGKVTANTVQNETASPKKSHSYNYSVLYRYSEEKPWYQMWDNLEKLEEMDKWRGINEKNKSFFIYVGAYFTERAAKIRKESLLQRTSSAPEIEKRT